MEPQTNEYKNPAMYENAAPLSVGDFIIMAIVGSIPLVGLIMMLVWAFNGNTNLNRRNYARAVLILMLVVFVLAVICSGPIIVMFTKGLTHI